MQGYQFFEECINRNLGPSAGSVIAINLAGDSFVQEGGICFNALCAVRDSGEPNGAVFARLCNAEYLGRHCRRVSEARARAIQPKLFEYLDKIA